MSQLFISEAATFCKTPSKTNQFGFKTSCGQTGSYRFLQNRLFFKLHLNCHKDILMHFD